MGERGDGVIGESINILMQLHIYFLFINKGWTNISCSSRREAALSLLFLLLCPSRPASTSLSSA